jgi:uncharacterized protein
MQKCEVFMYYKRHIQQKVIELAKHFKVILVSGARQVGKSTLLKNLFPDLKHIVFDPVSDEYNVRQDPDLFLDNFPAPIILDEIQYMPEVLPSVKRRVDLSDAKGQYFLTGSQNFSVMKNVAESLAGRVAILDLEGMTIYELNNILDQSSNWLGLFLNNPENLQANFKHLISDQYSLFENIWRGSMPGLISLPNNSLPEYFKGYLRTYIERDVRLYQSIKDLREFDQFIGILAAVTAQEINYAHLGREIGIHNKIAKEWLLLLEATYQFREISPYFGNLSKRISKKGKGYFTDTGVACYLQQINSPDALAKHPLLGAMFETYIVNQIIRLSSELIMPPKFYHWRTNGGAEVDLLLELNGEFYPIEIKCKTKLTKFDAKSLQAFRDSYPNLTINKGVIIYCGKECMLLNQNTLALPWNGIWDTIKP